MKILFYVHSSTLYGANRSLIELIIGLKAIDSSIEVLIVLPTHGPVEKELLSRNINFKVIPSFNWFYEKKIEEKWDKRSGLLGFLWKAKNKHLKNWKNQFHFNYHLRNAQRFKPDLIYVNSSLNPMGLKVSEKLKLPVIWHHRETVNEPAYGYYLENTDSFRKFMKNVNQNIFISTYLEQEYKKTFGSISSVVIFNGILFNRTGIKKGYSSKLKFGLVGRINDQKNQREVVELFIQFYKEGSNLELHIIGKGDTNFEGWLEGVKTPNITYHGFLDRFELYSHFNYLIANSKNEAFGRTIAEANSFGIPVLAKNSGAFPEIIENGQNGWLFKDINELKCIITDRFPLTENAYAESSNNAFLFANRHFKLSDNALKTLEAIQDNL